MFSALFPDTPREFPLRRSVRTTLRTAHILAAGTLLGGHVFNQPATALEPWLVATVASGLVLLATDLHASLAVLFELRGLGMVLKLVLVALVPAFWDARLPLLVAALIIGVVVSHLPKRYRHALWLLRGRIVPDRRSG